MMKILWLCLIFCVIQCNGIVISNPLEDSFEKLDLTPFETPRSDQGVVQRGARIVYGATAIEHQFPYYAFMYVSRLTSMVQCGGGLISRNFVVTAKHCVNDARQIQLRFGLTHKDYYEQLIYAAAIARNPTADIALVMLVSDVSVTNAVKPALLPRYVERNELFANQMATISGFGMDQSGSASPTMKFTDLKIISNGACIPYFGYVSSNVMCAKSADSMASTCQGDSGSPLVLRDENPKVIVGVASYEHSSGCDTGFPVGYVRTAQQLDWILTYSGVPKRL